MASYSVSPVSTPESRRAQRRATVSSVVGTTIEWYDFILYGTVAALVFPAVFFPSNTPTTAVLLSLSTFAVGFIARPIGGIIAGAIGDRLGRKRALVFTLLTAGLATFAIGFVPGFATIGVAAPIVLVLLRLIQGFGVGGEWGSAVVMVTEYADPAHRGRAGGWTQLGVSGGLFLSTGVLIVARAVMSDADFQSYGWRIPFWASGVLILVGLFIRLRVSESPAFAAMKEAGTRAKNPLWQVIRHHPKEILLVTGLRTADNVGFFIPCTFAISYGASALGYSAQALQIGLLISAVGGLIVIPFFARWSDRVGRRPLYLAGSIICVLFAFPFFWMVGSGNVVITIIGIFLFFNVGHNLLYAPQAAWFSELFGADVRSSGVNLGAQLSSILSGGLTPLIATALVAAANGSTFWVALFTAVSCLISVLCAIWTRETLPSKLTVTAKSSPGLAAQGF